MSSDALSALRRDLVAANRILFDQDILDAFGHVSARDPVHPERYYMARSMAPALVEEGDILEFNLDSNCVSDPGARTYLERFIHGEIYKARPDVGAVVHSHAAAVLPFAVSSAVKLCAVCHMSGFLAQPAPVFEIRDHAGDGSDLLIRSPGLGARLAECLGAHPLVLMRGHGMTVVGADVRQAVFRAVYASANARVQAAALQLGEVIYLTEAEARAADAANAGQADRAWDLWARRVERDAPT